MRKAWHYREIIRCHNRQAHILKKGTARSSAGGPFHLHRVALILVGLEKARIQSVGINNGVL
jgi:hypothetical protein